MMFSNERGVQFQSAGRAGVYLESSFHRRASLEFNPASAVYVPSPEREGNDLARSRVSVGFVAIEIDDTV